MTSPNSVIDVRHLTKAYGKNQVLKGIDLQVERGTMLALLGPNGAGKTTTVRILSTLLGFDGGTVLVDGHDVRTAADKVRAVIGLTGQAAAVDELLTGRENLVMMGQLYRLTAASAKVRAQELLAEFDLVEAAERPAKTYSGGMRRRLDLAVSLIATPPVLFLDEPTTGLDPRSRLAMWDIIKNLLAGGTTILLTTQYLDEADQLADRIVVIDGGKVIAEGTPGELKASLGGQRLLITLAEESDASAAAAALRPFATRPVSPNEGSKLMELPVIAADGLATEVVRALDAAGVKVTDIAVRGASLNDVFLTLTGHKAEEDEKASTPEEVAVG
jgi:ABC-2 type transport system ATP-binding protein